MGDLSFRGTIKVPAALSGLMLLIGWATALLSGLTGWQLVLDYLKIAVAVTFLATLMWIMAEVAKLGLVRADRPVAAVVARLRQRMPLLTLPCFFFPLFMSGFTTAKTASAFIVGFRWDRFWADADRAIFGTDPWIYTHGLFGSSVSAAWAWVYSYGWGLAYAFSMSMVALFARRRLIATFYSAMFASWIAGGWLLAYGFAAAGPVFAHLFDPALELRFTPLRTSLAGLLAPDAVLLKSQAYLARASEQLVAARGGGISAMPSMHVGACTIYICAARGTLWHIPAVLLWLLIFVGSVHFGYHYAVDGIVAALVALLCWRAAAAYYRPRDIAQPLAPALAA